MLKRALLRMVLVVFGVLGGFLAAEVILRLSPLPVEESASDALENRVAEGAIATRHSSRPGQPDFRDRGFKLGAEEPEGSFRLVVVGDSFTWGTGVLPEDAYPDRMAVRLSKRQTGQRVEVVNFSRPGWNSVQELEALERWIGDLHPDALVLGYCLNDAEPSERAEIERLRQGSSSRSPAAAPAPRGGRRARCGLRLRRPLPVAAGARLLYRYSRIYHLLFDKIENIHCRRVLAAYYHRLYAEPGWKEARRALAGFKLLADRRHIPFLIVVFPIFDSQLDWRYKYDDLHELVSRTAAELGIESLDLLAVAFRGLDGRRLALVPFTDGHPSEIAHRLAAQAILHHLTERGVLRAEPPAVARKRTTPRSHLDHGDGRRVGEEDLPPAEPRDSQRMHAGARNLPRPGP